MRTVSSLDSWPSVLCSQASNAQTVYVTTRHETRAGRGTQSEMLLVRLLLASCHDIYIYMGQTTVNETYTHRSLTEQQKAAAAFYNSWSLRHLRRWRQRGFPWMRLHTYFRAWEQTGVSKAFDTARSSRKGTSFSFYWRTWTHSVSFLLVFLLTYILGSGSWSWEQCWWMWLWKSTDMNSVILMILHPFLTHF